MKRWLSTIKRCDEVKSLPFVITSEEICQKIQNIKETKGLSPSGRHVGHYKATFVNNRILRIHTNMIIMAVENNLTPQRWTECTDIMVKKDK